ncbi:hypothetical protein RJ640_018178 [Escallonia rubra]|uniref:Integrase zinc-binding domain-containing protein n=1 Tax=Escallonia rubra TaxID=112253 RepID=A0AA88UD10_9ASTE|nr:hypothetical protein RJ640_018178 [Escallonia rubra]
MYVKTCHVCRQVKRGSQANEVKLSNETQVSQDLHRHEAENVLSGEAQVKAMSCTNKALFGQVGGIVKDTSDVGADGRSLAVQDVVRRHNETLEDHVLEELESLKRAVGVQDELREMFMELFANLQEQLDVVKVGVEEEDLLFNFVDGLQNWAKKELQCRGVKDVDEAIVMVESLTEYDRGGESLKPKEVDEPSEGNHTNGGGESPKAWHKGRKYAITSKSEGYGKLEEKHTKNKPNDGWTRYNKQGVIFVEAKLNGKPAQVLVDTGVNALVSPYNNAVCIIERGATCVVPMFGGTSSTTTPTMRLSGMWLVEGVKNVEAKGEGTYLAGLKVEDHVTALAEPPKEARNVLKANKGATKEAEDIFKGKESVPLSEPSREVKDVLKPKEDVVPSEITKRQPPRRKVDHQSKLDWGANAQNVAPCGMVPPKVEKMATTSKAKGEIIKLIREGLQCDPLAKELLQLVKSEKTWVTGGLLYTRDGRVYVLKWKDLRRMVIQESHDTQSTVHPGHRRTYALVTKAYLWPQVKKEVQMYVKTCHMCRQVKRESQANEVKLSNGT